MSENVVTKDVLYIEDAGDFELIELDSSGSPIEGAKAEKRANTPTAKDGSMLCPHFPQAFTDIPRRRRYTTPTHPSGRWPPTAVRTL
jgi:hypothetical protein